MKKVQQSVRSTELVMSREELLARIDAADLTREEELVVRMRYGLPVSDDTPVGPVAAEGTRELEVQAVATMRRNGQISRKELIVAQLRSRRTKS